MEVLTDPHTTPTHLLPIQMLHSAWQAVTPPVTSVGCKLQNLAVHMTGVAAVKYLGSQLMLLTVKSVYKNVYFGISLAQRICELAYPRFATNPVYVVCLYACVLCVLSARVMCMCWYLTLRFNEAAAIHSPWTDVTDSQGRIPRADCYSHPQTMQGSQQAGRPCS